MKFELHPLCTFFPRMDGKDFDSLKADIKANGQAHPIILFQGMILDGGNRYRALTELGIAPIFQDYEGEDPTGFVLSSNLHRRHLTPGQSAAIVSAAQDWSQAQTVGNPQLRNVAQLDTADDRAKLSGASHRTQQMADKLVKEASSEIVQEVTQGNISLPKALESIKPKAKPKDKQEPTEPTEPAGKSAEDAAQELERPTEDDGKTIAMWRYRDLKARLYEANQTISRQALEINNLQQQVLNMEEMEGQIAMLQDSLAMFDEMQRIFDANDKLAESFGIIDETKKLLRVMEGQYEETRAKLNDANRELLMWRNREKKAKRAEVAQGRLM